jgi:DNA (cytosine-5)-methyltransferase 1
MRSVEIFAGCGGLALGVAQAGFKHALVIEHDSVAAATLLANKKRGVRHIADWSICHQDIRDVSFDHLADKIDLLSGGPPCQAFSIGGKHEGPRDPRNLWPEAIRSVREIRPKAFLFENVRGLLRPAFSRYLEFIRLSLSWPETAKRAGESWPQLLRRLRAREEAGRVPTYRVVIKGINAADYGAAQKRHRAIVFGVLSECVDELAFPAPTHSWESLLWSQWISGEYWERHGIPRNRKAAISAADRMIVDRLRNERIKPAEKPWTTVRDAIGDLPRPRIHSEPLANHRLHPGARIYPRHTGSAWDEPAKALKAGDHGVPGGENILAPGDGSVRYFTLREMARLQGLPDSFEIGDGWKGPIRQLGNAVPVQVGRAFGRALAKLVRSKPRRAA